MGPEAAPFILELITKGGVVGLLCLIIDVLAHQYVTLRKTLVKVYAERDAYRVRYALYKNECNRANIHVDESAFAPLPEIA